MGAGLQVLAKSGALISTGGVALLVTFVIILLAYPVEKACMQSKCTYTSHAPVQLQPIFSPSFFALSLLVIAAGIILIRYSRWRETTSASQH